MVKTVLKHKTIQTMNGFEMMKCDDRFPYAYVETLWDVTTINQWKSQG